MRYLSFLSLWIAFGRISELEWGITPQEWLQSHWHVRWNGIILAEPTSTFFVFLLGFVILFLALRFFRNLNHQKSRLWFGLSMLAWSLSTFSAGISYQVFSYELKCAGRAMCLWTTPWEVAYLFLYVLSVKLLVIAVSYGCAHEHVRKYVVGYAWLMGLIYSVIVIFGVFLPNQFLISFELMVLFLVPSYLLMFLLNLNNYRKSNKSVDIRLIKAWIGMLLITIAYFAFYMTGISAWLWQRGIWFNANDVLHLLLIAWTLFVFYKVSHLIQDSD